MLTSGQTITTVTLSVPALDIDQIPKLDAWLRSILWDSSLFSKTAKVDPENSTNDDFEIHRLKARLPISDGSVKIVQGVREVFEILDAPNKDDGNSDTAGKIVLIGKNIGNFKFQEDFVEALQS